MVGILAGIAALVMLGCSERHEPGGGSSGSGEGNSPTDSGTRPPGQPPSDAGRATRGEDATVQTDARPPSPAGLQRRGAEVQIGSRYRPCSGDMDCVLVDVGCDGCCQQDAIAAELRAAYLMEHAELCADYRGAICDCEYRPLEVRCVDAQCAAVPTEDASRPDPYALTLQGMNVVIGEAYLACGEDADCSLNLL